LLADEADNRIAGCALAARARYLITGDRGLRALGKHERVRMVTPRAFFTLLRPRTR
jgi:predicted nucleic acid-binding protein